MNKEKKPYLIDVPVLIIFFARPETLSKVFEQIRKARPSKLFLYQDGPRKDRPDDLENIEKCRRIVDEVDWDCEILRKYQIINYGCDPSEFIAIKWVFDHVDRAIILEDDDVPSQSFFIFCKEMLEKYYDDERINIICGMNQLERYDNSKNSYIFTRSGSITGWASWKRNINAWEEQMDFIDNLYAINNLKAVLGKKEFKKYYKNWVSHRSSGLAHYESFISSYGFLNHRLNIVPKVNMITNIGIGQNASHGTTSIKSMPKGIRPIFFMKSFELDFPLQHPKYVIEDLEYKQRVDRIMGNGHPLVKIYREIEGAIYRIRAGEIMSLYSGLKRRIRNFYTKKIL